MANQHTTYTTREAAKTMGISVVTLRKKLKTAGVNPTGTVETGKRGRPELLWAASSISKIK